MGNSSSGGGESSLVRQAASCSTSSLDIQLLLSVNRSQSLLTESATLISLCSDDGDSLPHFPSSKVPGFSLVGLGDNLKFFSTTIAQRSEECKQSAVLVTAPTLPRLKCMLKECLSITKWAQSSTGQQPPNHIPWTNVRLPPVCEWIPEGSFFSPENFSLALLESKICKSTRELAHMSCLDDTEDDSRKDLLFFCPDGDDTLYYQVCDPENVESSGCPEFPQVYTQATTTEPSLPSLVVSNTYYTFPIPYESSESALARIDTLSHRRGKRGPPPLIDRRNAVLDIPYPGLPTAFAGTPSTETMSSSEKSTAYTDEKPVLCFEDMIKNLRLQCSSLELQIPTADPTWNSRSPEPLSSAACVDEQKKDSAEQKNIRAPLHNPVHLRARSVFVSSSSNAMLGSSFEEKQKMKLIDTAMMAHSITVTETDIPGDDAVSTGPAPRQLRSAMVKASSDKGKSPFKKVRFAVLECEPPSEHIHVLYKVREMVQPEIEDSPGKGGRNTTSNDKKQVPPLQRSATWSQRQPWKELRRARSASSNLPRSHSLLVDSFTPPMLEEQRAEPEAKNVNLHSGSNGGSTPAHSTSSLGRHSLSRIIKGPMFSGRDGRRATFALGGHEVDENAVRRENQSPPEGRQKRKSRMPIPLRSILTRFK